MAQRVRIGQMVIFEVNGYRQMDEVIGRTQCAACGESVLVTHARVILDADGSAMHTHGDEE